MAGEDARAPYTAGTAPDYHLDMEVARMDGAATVLIQRIRASIVGVPTVAVISATQFVVPPATQFSVVGLPTVVQANPQATVTLSNPAAAPLATVAVGTMAPVSVANPQATVTLTNPAAAPLATVAIGTYAPPATVAVATLAFPTLSIATANVVPPATVAVGTIAGLPTVTVANPQATVSLAGGTVTVANANATQAIGTVAGLPTVWVAGVATVTMTNPAGAAATVVVNDRPGSAYVKALSYLTRSRATVGGQNLLAVWNGSPSNVLDLTRLAVEADFPNVGVPTITPPMIRAYEVNTAASGGADLTARKYVAHPSQTSHASVVVRGDTTGDGSAFAASALMQTIAGAQASGPFAQTMPGKLYTLVGGMLTPLEELIGGDDVPIQIWPGRGFVVRVEAIASAAVLPSTVTFAVNAEWGEGIR